MKKILRSVKPFLKLGEEIQCGFYAAETPKQTLWPWALIGALPRYDRFIVATNLRFIICATSLDGLDATVLYEAPRSTLIEFTKQMFGDWTTSFGPMMVLFWQNRSEVKKANELRPSTEGNL